MSLAPQKPMDLREVIQVVSGFHDDELAHGLTTTFVMDAIRSRVHRPRHPSQERKIAGPQGTECGERLPDRDPSVNALLGPQVLVPPRQRDARRREHAPNTPAERKLRVGQMRHDFDG